MEHFSEKAPVDRQEVINRLKDYGIEDEVTKNLLSEWLEALRVSAETITDPKENTKARIENDIAYAQLLEDASFLGEAWDILNDSIDNAVNINDRELVDRINQKLDELESRG